MEPVPTIRMGQLAVARNDGVLRTLLGSCVGLILYDRASSVGGLAHVVLPSAPGPTDTPGRFVDTAVPALCEAMRRLAGRPIEPEARLAGGANMFQTEVTETIGRQNIDAAERELAGRGIPVVARDCGGGSGRRVSLDTTTGVVLVEIIGREPFEL
jgi:chemotaxis protein CheD